MSYTRVIPRDLFNEGNLLKCYGQIYLNLETAGVPGAKLEYDGDEFGVQQDLDSGALTLSNVNLVVRDRPYLLYRPVNSREAWPLYLIDNNEESIAVFAADGSFSREMRDFLQEASKAKSGRSVRRRNHRV